MDICAGFTGRVYRDGSCTGGSACRSANIASVKGPRCVGGLACERAKIVAVDQSCNGEIGACYLANGCDEDSCGGQSIVLTSSCLGHAACGAAWFGNKTSGWLNLTDACVTDLACDFLDSTFD